MSDAESEKEPFEVIKPINEVRRDVRQMEDNLRELRDELRTLEWVLLGGRGGYRPERCQRLCEGTARSMETIADDIEDLPNPYEEGDEP
jgi:hypothetical protein